MGLRARLRPRRRPLSATYSDFPEATGDTNLAADPRFTAPGDARPQPGSPVARRRPPRRARRHRDARGRARLRADRRRHRRRGAAARHGRARAPAARARRRSPATRSPTPARRPARPPRTTPRAPRRRSGRAAAPSRSSATARSRATSRSRRGGSARRSAPATRSSPPARARATPPRRSSTCARPRRRSTSARAPPRSRRCSAATAASPDGAIVEAEFRDPAGRALGRLQIGPVTADDRGGATNLLPRATSGADPAADPLRRRHAALRPGRRRLRRRLLRLGRARPARAGRRPARGPDAGRGPPAAPVRRRDGRLAPRRRRPPPPHLGPARLRDPRRAPLHGDRGRDRAAAEARASGAWRAGAFSLRRGRMMRFSIPLSQARAGGRSPAARRLRGHMYVAARDGQGLTRSSSSPVRIVRGSGFAREAPPLIGERQLRWVGRRGSGPCRSSAGRGPPRGRRPAGMRGVTSTAVAARSPVDSRRGDSASRGADGSATRVAPSPPYPAQFKRPAGG